LKATQVTHAAKTFSRLGQGDEKEGRAGRHKGNPTESRLFFWGNPPSLTKRKSAPEKKTIEKKGENSPS